jgi:excinuclease ABC subunit C
VEKIKFIGKTELSKLPQKAGVYLLYGDKGLLYIGKAINIRERVKNHFQQPTWRDDMFTGQVKKIGYIETDSEIEALITEATLIKKYQPRFNVVWRDDKNYFYISMSKEPFPQIYITHQPKDSAESAGPFVDGKSLKETLKVLRKVFPFRSCRIIPKHSCLWYHLDRCPAPCTLDSKIMDVPEIRNKIEKEAKKNAKAILDIAKGKKTQVLKDLEKEMKEASKKRDFERAGKARDRIAALNRVMLNARVLESRASLPSPAGEKAQKILRKISKTEKFISRIECYDISNIQGKEATGSMVVFINGVPDKNFYRKFKIKMEQKPNDVAMLKEILNRRFNHPEWGFPDLILIDGGKPQLNAAISVTQLFNHPPKVMAIAKKHNELFIEGKKEPLLLKNLPREVFNLILQLRDEAHRFAIAYHKKLREKSVLPK